MVEKLWEKELGIYIRSRADFPAIRKYFRKFTCVQDEGGIWVYFRFWEPSVSAELVSAKTKDHHSLLSPIFFPKNLPQTR